METSRRTKEVKRDVENRSADVSGPDVINALHVAGNTIKSAGDLAGAVNNIGATVAGASIVAKKTLGKLKGSNDMNSENNSDGEKP